ncbi:alpha/beta fold hydrolase [Rhizomonospora bruguierae]|uniref:alpha/beta fold hydrolase n=1 Tax=Rhizomonospora bruguierae TaxID=1581705 RepID=UPI001BCF962A|nr:alpha/beta hydrolase [Micromonospora sp. NBRC 107566]
MTTVPGMAAGAELARRSGGPAAGGIVRRDIDVNGVRTSYLEKTPTESAPTLLLLHGGDFSAPISAADWVPQLDRLGTRFRVVAPDRLGQGFTDNPSGRYRYDMASVCAHVGDFVAALGLDRYVVVGHSRGAMSAVSLALAAPHRVAGLVVLDSNTLTPAQDGATRAFYARARERRLGDTETDLVRREPALNSYAEDHLTDDFIGSRLDVWRSARAAAAREAMADEQTRTGFLRDVDRLRQTVLQAIDRGELRADVLVVWGREDPSAPLARGLELFHLLADSPDRDVRLHVVNHAGHYAFRERADEVSAVVAGFAAARLSTDSRAR